MNLPEFESRMALGLGNSAKEMHKGSRDPLSIKGQRQPLGGGVNWLSDLWRPLSIVALE